MKPNMTYKSIRLFQDDRLESLTKVHPFTPLIIFIPVLMIMYWRSANTGLSVDVASAYLISGLLVFSLLEYSIHRFVFHFKPLGPKTERLLYLFHGIHHDDPHDPYRLVMPPTVSVPLASIMYFVFSSFLPPPILPVFFFGFIFGYLVYDMGHYALHHLRSQNPIFRYLRKYHYIHHFVESERGYGVSSPLWDYVFQTQITKDKPENQSVAASDH